MYKAEFDGREKGGAIFRILGRRAVMFWLPKVAGKLLERPCRKHLILAYGIVYLGWGTVAAGVCSKLCVRSCLKQEKD